MAVATFLFDPRTGLPKETCNYNKYRTLELEVALVDLEVAQVELSVAQVHKLTLVLH